MSIRLRLALWYGALFAVVLLLVTLFSYVFHVRGHYDDRDRALITTTGHAVAEAIATANEPHLVVGSGGLEVGLRLYDRNGMLRESTLGAEALPPLDPRAMFTAPVRPPFDALAALAPPLDAHDAPTDGAFGLFNADGQRWRAFVQPLRQDGAIAGYVAAFTPLGRLDASIQGYRVMLVTLVVAGLAAALGGSWAIASGALRPIARMTRTAGAIAQSRDLSHRITEPPHRDELGRLAATFNAMLVSIETAYHAQQRFVADASHELRAPLTAIQGNLELLRRHGAMPEADRAEALAEAEREAGRMTRLVADLLVLARADAGVTLQRRPVDLDMVVLDMFRTARQLAGGQTLILEPFEPARAMGDEDRLKQLVLILLDNALKYTPAKGSVTLGLRRYATSVEILVRDSGVGVPAADLPHVFERFYRADPARSRDPGGTGLGLPIARWIAQQHGGDVTLASEPGQGTTATIRLPLFSTDPIDGVPVADRTTGAGRLPTSNQRASATVQHDTTS
jgi:two-component system, OmpR family, sensor kinase